MKETMKKLDEAGYRLHPEKYELFKKEAEWVGHQINQDGIRPLQDNLEAITKINVPKNEKELNSFLGAIQYLTKYIKTLSAQTDILRKLLKKTKRMDLDRRTHRSVQQFKEASHPIAKPSVLQLE